MSPGCTEVLVQPARAIVVGVPASAFQCWTFPLSSFTSKLIIACGLAHRNLVTVTPLKTTTLLVSYALLPWCAKTGTHTIERHTTAAKNVSSLTFNVTPPM